MARKIIERLNPKHPPPTQAVRMLGLHPALSAMKKIYNVRKDWVPLPALLPAFPSKVVAITPFLLKTHHQPPLQITPTPICMLVGGAGLPQRLPPVYLKFDEGVYPESINRLKPPPLVVIPLNNLISLKTSK